MKKIFVIIGHYGSGKTEFSINFAIEHHCKILVDLDIVNPYFRSSDVIGTLKEKGIHIISPNFANTNIDVPSISGEVYSAFEGEENVVFDVGGDDAGAIALGRFHKHFERCGYEMYMVINTNRPMTTTVEEIVEQLREIEYASRLKVTGLINNTNLMENTSIETILNGQKIIELTSKQTGIPIVTISAMRSISEQLPEHLKHLVLPIDIFLKKPWEV